MAVFKFSGRFSFFPIVVLMALAVRAPGAEPPQRPENANVTEHGLPHGATGRVGTFRFRVYDIAPVQSLEFSPDGKYLAALVGPRVLVWNAATGDLLRDLATSRPWPSQLLFSSDGKHLIGTTIPLTRWRVADWNLDPPARGVRNVHELRRSIAEHQGKKKYLDQPASGMVSVRLVESDRELLKTATRTQPALSPDESLLLVTGREEKGDAFVKVWNMDRKEAIHTFMVGAVGHIIVTPDGRNVLTLAANEPIRVFDLVTGKEGARLPKLRVARSHLFMSPSGKHVAIVADDETEIQLDETEIQLVEIASGQVKLTIPCRYLRSPVTFSPSGKMIVFVAGTQVRMIDTSDGKEIFSHRGSPEAASTIEFSGDAKRLLIGGWHRNPIGIWDFEEQELTTVDFGDDMNGSPSLSPDGRLVAAQDRGQVHLWSADGDRKSIPAKLPPNRRRFLLRRRGGVFESDVTGLIDDGARLSGHSQPAVDMALSADEMTLASCSPDKTIRIWNVKDGTESARINLDHEPTPPLALAPDASLVAVTVDGKLKVWRTDNLKNVSTVEVEADSLQTIQFSADAAQIAIGDAAGGVRVFKSVGGHEVKAWQAHDKAVSGLAFSADGKLLCSAGADGAVHFWNADTLQKRSSVTEKLGPVTEINLGADSNQLAMVEADGRISVWDIAAQTIAHRYSETSGTPTGVKIDTNNHKVRWLYGTTRYNRYYREWELKTGNTRGKSIGLSWSHTLQYAFSPDSRTLATATSGAVRLWELPSGKWLKDLESPVDCSKCIAISPDGDLVAAGGMGLVIFHLREDRPPLVVGTDRVGTPEHIGFSPDGRLLVVERSPQSVQIIEASTGRLIRELATVPGTVRDKFTFSHDGRILMFYEGYWLGYSAGQPCRLTFWEVETGRKLGELAGQPLGAQSHSLSADGKLLATGNANGSVLLWDYEQIMRDQFLRAGEKPTELTFVYWNALSAPDPVEAYRAIGALSQRPDEALTLIEDALDALPPAGDTAPEQIDALVKQLGAERLAEQRQASVRLRQLGKRAHPALQRALDAEPPAPVAARIKLLLAAQTQQPQFKLLRALRAIQVLEQIGGDRARRVLERLADSDSERLMSEAKSALARLPAGTGAEHETP